MKKIYSNEAMLDARDALTLAFPDELSALDRERAYLVYQDYLLAFNEDGCAASEYARRIGKGNLKAYADCLIVGQKRRI